ncbi:hypothetical protein BJ138DRAFT_1112060 [Hygrophoropsis aurantiaca]|uniref:Uncharacterized protein n=1 Tax=Hygrophoropsis aurantiaca TaxID=72124 RepID=A0ACB8AJ51_9AGAM|nr:hypothetical protein BJ138DRAFT_1112060 [Hygrophoropsis aurantiaca]
MSAQRQLTLYRLKVELALAEAKVPHKVHDVDIFNKPDWFISKVYPVGKVPVVTYGGPDVDPENPSPLSEKIAESAVILEFIADLYPDSGLLPKDPVARANVRFIVETFNSQFVPADFGFSRGKEPLEKLLKAIETIQDLLSETNEFAVGDTYTIADATLVPFIARMKITYENDVGRFTPGEGHKLQAELQKPLYTKFMRYSRAMLERQSTKDTFDEELVTGIWNKIYARD